MRATLIIFSALSILLIFLAIDDPAPAGSLLAISRYVALAVCLIVVILVLRRRIKRRDSSGDA